MLPKTSHNELLEGTLARAHSPPITAGWRCSPGEMRLSRRSRNLLSSLDSTPQGDGRSSGCELLNISLSVCFASLSAGIKTQQVVSSALRDSLLPPTVTPVKLAGWMAEPELLLDSNIRLWVVLPIVFITFLVGVIRHYVSILLQSDKKLTLEQVSDRSQYADRYDEGNVTNVLPMILIGGWINWTFSGFVTTKVPFPLTLRFKPMLQQGVELLSLDASWVSSASWYFLNVFGLRSMYSLILGQDNGADQSRIMQEQMSGAAMAMPADTNKAFKGEWEALELTDHQWALESVEEDLMSRELDFDGLFSKELPCGIF
ncbi:hypothetical protein F7725_017124 [Dissostichus mawsoni]|uniref:ER membrane protein complex subunit 3 n=1 Tax=Dissostichus mawsoni TaxID=36200 RepID=A0A7J5Z5L6_DISMA|nr:hypothetical protein F7725_017124 [Dissostichus mawsoni]